MVSLLRSIILCAATTIFMGDAASQLDGQIVGLHNPAPSVWKFIRFDPQNDEITTLFDLPFSTISTGYSATLDPSTPRYFLCTGTDLWILDPTGISAPVQTTLPVPAGASFAKIEYDDCTGSLVGIINAYPDSMTISRYDLATGTFAPITNYPSIFITSDETGFNPVTRQYFVTLNPQLFVVDVDSGDLVDLTMMIPSGETFGHIAADCNDGQVFGTSADINASVKYLSSIDLMTGAITHVSETGIDHGFWKPAGGGSCIDHVNGSFYWSGAGGLIVGASLTTGEALYEPSSHNGEFFYIECLSPCACLPTAIPLLPTHEVDIVVFGNSIEIRNSGTTANSSTLTIHDHHGRLVIERTNISNGMRIQLPTMAAGTYAFQLSSEGKRLSTGRFVHIGQ